jgi:hypothetical protein
MDSRANPSSASSSWMPVFDVGYHTHNDGQNWFQGWNSDEANALTNTQHAAGSVNASPLPPPSPPTSAIYSFDQWTAFLDTGHYSNSYASRLLGASNASPSANWGFQDSELSSCYSCVTLASLIPPSMCNSNNECTARPHHQLCPHSEMMYHHILRPQTRSYAVRTAPSRPMLWVV